MISVEKISFSYQDIKVLENLEFTVRHGEFVGIIGPNGAGKSTLLKLINRILLPDRGAISIKQKLISNYSRKELAKTIGFVPQEFQTAFHFNAMEIVMMGRFPYQRGFLHDAAKDRKIAADSMTETDCYILRNRNISTLSGGERQRVVLASALAQQPEILLLDEPTNSLDLKHQIHFYEILKRLQKEQRMTILSVTHDVNLAARYCDRIVVLKKGSIHADGPVESVLNKEVLEPVYETPLTVIRHPQTGLPVLLPGAEGMKPD